MVLAEYGLKLAKFFPAEQMGGVPMIKALSAPFGDMLFMPTGGIGPDNLLQYLSYDKVVACGGSWMVKESLIRAGKFEEIETLARQAVMIAQKAADKPADPQPARFPVVFR